MNAPLSHLDITHALFALKRDLEQNRELLADMEERGEADDELRKIVSEEEARVARFDAASSARDFHCSDPYIPYDERRSAS